MAEFSPGERVMHTSGFFLLFERATALSWAYNAAAILSGVKKSQGEDMREEGRKFCRVALLTLLVIQSVSLRSWGQNYTGDARRIGMGGTGENENIGSQMIADEQPYRSIVIPLGLIQVIRDRHYF